MTPVNVTVIQPTIIIDTTRIRVAAYCRVSSDSSDQLNSYMTQIRYYEKAISESKDEEFVGIYADEGITGTRIDKRDEFLRLLQDCRRGKIDRIITKSISRFAINTKECLTCVRELTELGITVMFEKEGIDTAEMSDEMLITIMGGLAQEESTTISKNLKWSYQTKMKNGTIKLASAAFGYKLSNGNLEIIPSEAEIVKKIFSLYINGNGISTIFKALNDTRTSDGRWSCTTIKRILQNEKYVGDQLFQKFYTTTSLPFRQVINRGELDKYYFHNRHNGLICRDDFEIVQKLLESKKSNVNINWQVYALSKTIYCVQMSMMGDTHSKK